MRYRKLDASYDMTFGKGLGSFWNNVPDAPAQAVLTRLNLYLGEWFLDMTDGTPWRTQVLGNYTGSTRDVVLRARALGSQGVTAILSFSSTLDRNTRAYAVNMQIDTMYGAAYVLAQAAFAPSPPPAPPSPTYPAVGLDSTDVTIDTTYVTIDSA